jgi:Zn-dependent peptidase ImmA (M78 family)
MLFPEDYNASPQKLHFCMAEPVRNEINWKEWQADTLASVLLMPKEIVKQALFLFGFGETIPRINRVYSSEDYWRFSMMAELLGVSKQALSIRISQLGLVERNDFDDPYSIIDVFNYGGM